MLFDCYGKDSISGIYAPCRTARIFPSGPVVLEWFHNIRATGSHIRGTNGTSNHCTCRVFNNTAKYVDQGGGKRNGSFAIYLEPWHADMEIFLQMRKNHGDEELKARDLFYGLWIPDLFMERVKTDGTWTLMCPDECPGLSDVYGDEFKTLYEKYEDSGRGRITVSARKLWCQIMDAQMETGTPYLCYKDAANRKSNQKNVGIIKSSNLCTEIMEVSTPEETAVCNLASIALPSCIDHSQTPPVYDFAKLHDVSRAVTYNLNKVIDVNYFIPHPKRMRVTPNTVPLVLVCKVWLIPLFKWACALIQRKHANSIAIFLKPFITLHSKNLAPLPNAMVPIPLLQVLLQGILQYDMWNVEPSPDR